MVKNSGVSLEKSQKNLHSHSFVLYHKRERVRIKAIYEGERNKTHIKGGTGKRKTQKVGKNERKVAKFSVAF